MAGSSSPGASHFQGSDQGGADYAGDGGGTQHEQASVA